MAAPSENREELLEDLQKFANMGIPDFRDKVKYYSMWTDEFESSLNNL